ncbi:hypothetical protein, partial [Erwinia amylovora]|uniref:hypothetical protein n=1 Tax=Erwinia amylovora TaxID=552 RepID=UPI003860148B
MRDGFKKRIVELAQRLLAFGFVLDDSAGTASVLKAAGIVVRQVFKVLEGRPHIQ